MVKKPKQPPKEMTGRLAKLQRAKNQNAAAVEKVAAALDAARKKKQGK